MFGWPKLTTTGFLLLSRADAVKGSRILDEKRETISSKLNQYLCRGGCFNIFRAPLHSGFDKTNSSYNTNGKKAGFHFKPQKGT
jgi:hypothetical protein